MATVIDAIIKLQDDMSAKLKQINNNLKQTESMAKRVNRSVASMGKGFNSAASAMQPFALAAVAVAGTAITAYASFDTKYHAFLNKLSDDTKKHTEISQDAFYKMGTKVAVPLETLIGVADQIGGAIDGLNGKEINELTESVSRFAVATDTQADVAALMFTNTMNSFGLSVKDVPHMLDGITQASNLSSANVDDLAEALKMTSTSANSMNQTLDTTLASLATLANNGLKGSMAGTGLSNIFERMANPKFSAVLTDMGIQLFDTSGSMRQLTDVAEEFNRVTAGMSGVQKQSLALEAFGDQGSRAFLLLANNLDAYKKNLAAVQDSQGAANKAYDEMKQSLGGSLEIAKNNAMAILYKIGEKLAPTIKVLVEEFSKFTEKILDNNDGTIDLAITLGKLVIGTFAVTKGIGLALTGLSAASGGVLSFASACAKAGGIVPMIFGRVSLVFRTFGSLIKNVGVIFKLFGMDFARIGLTIARGLMSFMSVGGKVFMFLIRGITMLGRAFMANPIGLAITVIIGIIYLLYTNWDTVVKYVDIGIKWLSSEFQFLKNTTVNAFNYIVNGVMSFINYLGDLLAYVGGAFMSGFMGAWQAVSDFFNGIWNGMVSTVSGVVDTVKGLINQIISALNGVSFTVPDWVPSFGGQNFSLNIPLLFTGSENWKGGLAKIHDQGGEIVDLPQGTRVIPHDKSIKEARDLGRSEGQLLNSKRSGISIAVAKIADSIIIREEADLDKLMTKLTETLESYAINAVEGAV